MAGISSSYSGIKPVILEKNDRIGKKILATGNGKCNLTNKNIDISHYHGKNPGFALNFLNHFGPEYTLEMFEKMGLEFITDDEGRVFPESLQAGKCFGLPKA